MKGNQYVGAIAGYIESINQAIIENCHVINSQVAATGDKAGAVVGFGANAGTTIKNCTATESTVKAGRDAGQIVGCSKIELVIDCSAIYVTVSYDENYKGEKPNTNICNEVIGRVL